MKIKKLLIVSVYLFVMVAVSCSFSLAEEKATPEEVLNLILEGVPVIEQLGADGLKAFSDPKGEFVFKDTYIYVVDCEKMIVLAHPNTKLIGIEVKNLEDKNPDPSKRIIHNNLLCEVGKRPYGGWVEYYWEKLGEDKPSRKISFSILAPNTNYALISGIYDDNTSVEELNSKLK